MTRKLLQIGKRVKITKTDDTCIIGTIIEKIIINSKKEEKVKNTIYSIMVSCYETYVSENDIKNVKDYSYIKKEPCTNGYYILGQSNGVYYAMERPEFKCGWYFPRIKIVKSLCLQKEINNLNIDNFKEIVIHPALRDEDIYTFFDLIKSYTNLIKVSEMFYRGSSGISDYTILKDIELYNNINEKIKIIIEELDKILCPSNQ